jgi:hypothetical protein
MPMTVTVRRALPRSQLSPKGRELWCPVRQRLERLERPARTWARPWLPASGGGASSREGELSARVLRQDKDGGGDDVHARGDTGRARTPHRVEGGCPGQSNTMRENRPHVPQIGAPSQEVCRSGGAAPKFGRHGPGVNGRVRSSRSRASGTVVQCERQRIGASGA